MALGRKNVSVARANSSADVFRLAGFLGDNNLIHHEAPFEDWIRERPTERIVNRTTCGYRKSHPGWRRCRDGLSSLRDDRSLEATGPRPGALQCRRPRDIAARSGHRW